MSKRSLLLIVVVAAVVLLASPYAIGMFTESRLTERIELYDLDPVFAAEVSSYERGWRESRAVLRFGPDETYLANIGVAPLMGAMLTDMHVPVIVEIAHGPLLLAGGAGLGTAAVRAYIDPEWEIGQIAVQFLGVPYLFELRGRAGFGTGFVFEGEVPPFDGAFPAASYNFSGLNLTGRIDGADVDFDARIESAGLQAPDMSAILESFSLTGDYVYRPSRIALGTGRIAIERVMASNPMLGGNPLFAANDLAAESWVTENADATRIALGIIYSGGTVAVADELAISNLSLGLELGGIDADAADRYYALLRDPAIASNPEAAAAGLMSAADQIVAGSPSISLDPIRFSMASGDFDARLAISIDGGTLPTGAATDLQDIAVLMGAVDATFEATVSKALAEELAALALAQQLAMAPSPTGEPLTPGEVEAMAQTQASITLAALAAQGLLVDDGTSYSTKIELTNGTATANGQPIPLGAFF